MLIDKTVLLRFQNKEKRFKKSQKKNSILSKNNVDIISLEGLNRYEQNMKYTTCSILWHLYKCTVNMHIVKLSKQIQIKSDRILILLARHVLRLLSGLI